MKKFRFLTEPIIQLYFQVKILFSDKTGTLTKNEMIFQQCSVNGKKYKISDMGIQEADKPNILKLHQYNLDLMHFLQVLSTCHTVQVGGIRAESTSGDHELEKTFEIIDQVDIDENIRRSVETTHNTIQNEQSVPENLIYDKSPTGIERKSRNTSNYKYLHIYQIYLIH